MARRREKKDTAKKMMRMTKTRRLSLLEGKEAHQATGKAGKKGGNEGSKR